MSATRSPRIRAIAVTAASGLVIAACSSSGETHPTAPAPTGGPESSSSTGDSGTPAASGGPSAPGGSAATDGASPRGESPSSAPQSEDSDSADDIVANPPAKSWQDALDAARDHHDGTPSKIELEPQESGGLEYKVELISGETKVAVQYDADSLDKLSSKSDDLGDDAAEKQAKTFDPGDIIGLADAADTARGQQDGVITAWKVEGKDSDLVQYEFDILPPGADEDVEVAINANDGSVIDE